MAAEFGTGLRFNPIALDALLLSGNGPVARDLTRRAIKVQGEARRLTKQPGKGRVYKRKGRVHQASAPGEPPATDMGLLSASIDFGLGKDPTGLYAVIGSPVKYARFLEFGTRHIAPRPFLRAALTKAGE